VLLYSNDELKTVFLQLLSGYAADQASAQTLWEEIAQAYGSKKRHYHNLAHLAHLYAQLLAVKTLLNDWDCALFALFYHDVVYKVHKTDNEEKSAELAVKQLKQLGAPLEIIDKCQALILATKTHVNSTDPDVNLFTDADLSILGADWEVYADYSQKIRREYAVYPDLLYLPGRKKVLKHFLDMERIFKTDFFFERYEKTARENLTREMNLNV
jgi:predicted metal-dependent HD superfamily phosphohydrolase